MNPPLLEVLRGFAEDYGHFCSIAETLTWVPAKRGIREFRPSWHHTLSFCMLQFPEGHVSARPEAAAAQALLTALAFQEKWPHDFWKIPETERRESLTAGAECFRGAVTADSISSVRYEDAEKVITSHTGTFAPLPEEAGQFLRDFSALPETETVRMKRGQFCPEWTWISVHEDDMLVTVFAVGD